jgi:hypothetical protein
MRDSDIYKTLSQMAEVIEDENISQWNILVDVLKCQQLGTLSEEDIKFF